MRNRWRQRGKEVRAIVACIENYGSVDLGAYLSAYWTTRYTLTDPGEPMPKALGGTYRTRDVKLLAMGLCAAVLQDGFNPD